MLDDTSNARWTDAQVYTAINQALAMWDGRVLIPHLYQPASYTWTSGTYEYALPAYMDARYIQPQMRRSLPMYPTVTLTDDTSTWVDVPGWSIEPTTTNSRILRFETPPYSVDARIIYWSRPVQIPTTPIVINVTGFTASATTFTTTTVAFAVPFFGYYQMENEILSAEYSSRTTTTVFANAVRALFNTAAAIHVSATPVYFCITAPDERLFVQLHNQAMAILHRMRFALAAPEERSVHGQMIQLYQAQADAFWRQWTPMRPIKSVLSRKGMTL